MAVKLSLREKLDLLPILASICLTISCAAITGLYDRGGKTWWLHVCYAVLRKVTSRVSPLQIQYLTPSTTKTYTRFMAQSKQTPKTVELGDTGAHGHWIGSPDASNILIWYHGGGFGLPANRGYFKFFAQLMADAQKANKSLAIFCLSYTLAPHAQYPTQLRQAVEALRVVLQHHQPGNVLLGGDSAGGNLVGGVLSHLAHTHPEINPITLSAPLKGAVMLSPWTALDSVFPGVEVDSSGDIITEHVAGPWAGAYLGSAKRDFYTDLSRAPADWYAAFPVQSLLICAGSAEILMPLMEDLVQKIREGRKVEFMVGKGECHVAPVYNLYLRDNRETEQGKRVKSWLKECI